MIGTFYLLYVEHNLYELASTWSPALLHLELLMEHRAQCARRCQEFEMKQSRKVHVTRMFGM
jgi:hypothetical protein